MIRQLFRGAAFAALLFVAGGAQAVNLVNNPGFESGTLAGWRTNGGTAISTDAHSGSFAASGFNADYLKQVFAPIDVPTITEFSFWTRRDGGPFIGVIFLYSGGYAKWHTVDLVGDGDDWFFLDMTDLLDDQQKLWGFKIYGTWPGPAYFDDFTLTAVPEPSSGLLMLAGVALAALKLRRRSRG
jgi:hypothetical protein